MCSGYVKRIVNTMCGEGPDYQNQGLVYQVHAYKPLLKFIHSNQN